MASQATRQQNVGQPPHPRTRANSNKFRYLHHQLLFRASRARNKYCLSRKCQQKQECPAKVKRASTPDTHFNTCDDSVDGTSMSFALDTGAMISIIPEEFVSDTAEKCGEVLVRDANGGTRIRQKVRINVVIGN